MTKTRAVLGLVAGVILILSSGAHSLLGWPGLRGQLVAAQTPADLVQGLMLGWQFGGVAMLAFGIIVVATFARGFRGETVSMLPAAVIGAAYLAFGAWALLAIELNPFFLVFIVPGVLLVLATTGARGRPTS
jgi:hypothetical protein